MVEWSKTLRSGRNLPWRRGFKPRSCHIFCFRFSCFCWHARSFLKGVSLSRSIRIHPLSSRLTFPLGRKFVYNRFAYVQLPPRIITALDHSNPKAFQKNVFNERAARSVSVGQRNCSPQPFRPYPTTLSGPAAATLADHSCSKRRSRLASTHRAFMRSQRRPFDCVRYSGSRLSPAAAASRCLSVCIRRQRSGVGKQRF